MKPLEDRIVVTGMGVVSPLGNDLETFHANLAGGKQGVVPIQPRFETGYQVNRAGVVPEFDLADFGDFHVPHLGRTASFGVAACKNALDQGALAATSDCGVIVGTAMGEALEIESALDTGELQRLPGSPAALQLDDKIAAALELGGPRQIVATTCSSGNHALDWAAQILRTGAAKAMLAVGADTVGHVDLLGFCRLLLQAPERCQPFDLHRKGTILSEGAGAVLLERADDALRRGATIHAELAGAGLSCDAGGAFKSKIEDVRTLENAARAALREAEITPEEVDLVSAHASGTKLNDARETQLSKALFGERAPQVPMNGIKSMLGHAQGAAASFEFVASVLSIQRGVLYPTIHLEHPDPQCDLDYVPNVAREGEVNVVLSNAFGVGGNNAIVVVRRWRG